MGTKKAQLKVGVHKSSSRDGTAASVHAELSYKSISKPWKTLGYLVAYLFGRQRETDCENHDERRSRQQGGQGVKNEELIRRVTEHAERVVQAARAALNGRWPERNRSMQATAAVGCWFIGLEHCAGMVMLGQQGRFLSGWALMRPLIELQLKGYWCLSESEAGLRAHNADSRSYKDVGQFLHDGQKHSLEKRLEGPCQDEVRCLREGLDTEVHQNLIGHSGPGKLTVRKVLSTMTHGGPIAWNMVISEEGWDTKDVGVFWKVYPAAFAATSSALLTAATARELDPSGARSNEKLSEYRRIAEEWQLEWERIAKRRQ